jgi:hypothetical protein
MDSVHIECIKLTAKPQRTQRVYLFSLKYFFAVNTVFIDLYQILGYQPHQSYPSTELCRYPASSWYKSSVAAIIFSSV